MSLMVKSIISLTAICFFTVMAHAGGPVHGTKAVGMGTAFIAVADDPSAIMFNPAGLAQLKGTHLYAGTAFIMPSSDYKSPFGQTEETDFQIFVPPHLYLCSDFGNDDLVFGIGLYSPFGIGGRKWDSDGLTRYLSVESFIATFSVNPTVCWKISDWVSVACGIDYLFAINEAERKLDQSFFGAGDGNFEMEADGDGWGFDMGLFLRPSDRWRIGITYRSGIEVDLEGDVTLSKIAPPLQPLFGGSRYETSFKTTTDFPELYGFGIAFFPNDRWVIAMDAEFGRWSSFDRSTLDIKKEVPAAGFVDATGDLDWDDAWQFKIGTQVEVKPGVSLRCGYAYIETMVPSHTLEPSSPEADAQAFTIGIGFETGVWVIDLFYMFSYYDERQIDNDILDGTYDNMAHSFGFSVGRSFNKKGE